MLTAFLALAQVAPVALPPQPISPRDVPPSRERAGPTAFENHPLSQPHKNMDNRMFPDIAIGAMRIDGGTLYVRVTNKGGAGTRSSTLVAARAESGGIRSELAQARTGRMSPGESRWVPITGFKASASGQVFALANANFVSAVARISPSSAGALDRSGNGCESCEDRNEANNILTAAAAAIARGKPE